MKTIYRFTIRLLLLGLCLCPPAEAGRVLVVHSYHQNYDWVEGINESLEVVFKVHGIPYQIFYMDTKRQPTEASKKAAAQKAKEVVSRYKPQVVIAVDDNAQAYFVKNYVNNSPIQFVFCGVNADPELYGYPATNVTGILERTYPAQTLRTLKAIIPSAKRVAVISDDSATANVVLPRIKSVLTKKASRSGITITGYIQPATFSQWQQTITALEKDPTVDALLIPLFHTVKKDDSKTSMPSIEVIQWTTQNCTKPVVGLWNFLVHGGGLLAITVSPNEHGRVAAQMALGILKGKKANQIPMQVNQDGQVMINLKNKEHLAFDTGFNVDQVADYVIQ